MKNVSILICLASVFLHFSHASAAQLSQPTNGIYLAFSGYSGKISHSTPNFDAAESIQFNDKLICLPFCDAGKVELFRPSDPAYIAIVKMEDSKGNEVIKTSVGKEFGGKFAELRSPSDTRLYPCLAWGAYTNNQDLGGAFFLTDNRGLHIAPNDLFKIKDKGSYTMEIQMQMFYLKPSDTNSWNRDLIKFPTVKIRIEKP